MDREAPHREDAALTARLAWLDRERLQDAAAERERRRRDLADVLREERGRNARRSLL